MKKKRLFSRGVMFLLCLVFAVLFLLPTVLTITNSFMSEKSRHRRKITPREKYFFFLRFFILPRPSRTSPRP